MVCIRWFLPLILILAPLAPTPQAQTTIYISPDSIASGSVGESFSVEVRVAAYEDLRAFSIEVLYNQAALRHVGISQGNVFSAGGGPGGLFLSSASVAAQGYILGDGARIGAGGSTGDDNRLFTIHFQTIGPGSTNIYFGQILLRDAANSPLDHVAVGAAASVVSPMPPDLSTVMVNPGDANEDFTWLGTTGLESRVLQAGTMPRGKLTAARYDTVPPGGDDAPFLDPDGTLSSLGTAQRYWELTSSLGGPFVVDLGFSYEGLSDLPAGDMLRVASRPLAAGPGDEWTLIPAHATLADPEAQTIRIQAESGAYPSAQFAVVFERAVSYETSRHPARVSLDAPFPNPTSGAVSIGYTSVEGSAVIVSVYDLMGRQVSLLVDERGMGGPQSLVWEASGLAAGMYVVRLQTGSQVMTRKLVVTR